MLTKVQIEAAAVILEGRNIVECDDDVEKNTHGFSEDFLHSMMRSVAV